MALVLQLPNAPCDSTILRLLERVELEELFGLLRAWMLAQIADQNKDFDQLLDDGSGGAKRFVTQVTLDARAQGMAIVQTSFDTGESHERAALNAAQSTLELEGVLIQAVGAAFSVGVVLHNLASIVRSPPSRLPTSS